MNIIDMDNTYVAHSYGRYPICITSGSGSRLYDENGKATRNKGIRRLLKKSRVVRTFDAPVKINGHMMYRVDNGYVKVKNFK